jgi:hypothetical protein
LPHEILETLAHSNFLAPRPCQTDPGVLYDLLKIRKLVDEAADLAVRAQNGTASSALGNDNGHGGGALGLSNSRNGAGAKLSPERKYRMREHATAKLAMAYRLDEVAASVATMQSASALDTVAMLVLARNPANTDAKYVKFFHEKIPSRQMAEYTPLTPLDEIVMNEPGHAQAAVLRTRALTRMFKDDHAGAIVDLTESLAICRLETSKQKAGRAQLVTMVDAKDDADKRKMWTRDWVNDNKVAEEDQPRGMEMQLLFQRGNQYLTLACQSVKIALEHFKAAQRAQEQAKQDAAAAGEDEAPDCRTSAETEAYKRALEAREIIRKYAKRALRDYTQFLSHLDYAYASAEEVRNSSNNGTEMPRGTTLLDSQLDASSTALIRRERAREPSPQSTAWTAMIKPVTYDLPTLLSPAPPADLPPFPPVAAQSTALTVRSSKASYTAEQHTHHEALTYHPLLPETLHAFLLAHSLLQTPPTTLYRIANNVARLARLADGYPFFLSARSPARADWAEILRKTGNWVGLSKTWEGLMKMGTAEAVSMKNGAAAKKKKAKSAETPLKGPAKTENTTGTSLPTRDKVDVTTEDKLATVVTETTNGTSTNHDDDLRERIHKEAVIEALGDDRVVDDDTFKRAVEVRERRAWREMEADGLESVVPAAAAAVNGDVSKEEVVKNLSDSGIDIESGNQNQNTTKPNTQNGHALSAEDITVPATNGNSGIPYSSSNGVTTSEKPAPSTTTPAEATTTPAVPIPTKKVPAKPTPTPAPVAKDEEYLIGTERASAIAAWVLEAPVTVDMSVLDGGGRPRAKVRRRRPKPVVAGVN